MEATRMLLRQLQAFLSSPSLLLQPRQVEVIVAETSELRPHSLRDKGHKKGSGANSSRLQHIGSYSPQHCRCSLNRK